MFGRTCLANAKRGATMLEALNKARDEIVELTQQLIRIRSFTGDERELAELILSRLREFEVDEAFIDGIGNVIGVIYGNVAGPSILLNGHLDVVPEGNRANWKGYDPFGGEIDDSGNIHGRGASDLKGGLAVQLCAMKLVQALKKKGLPLKGQLIFSAVVHEEAAEMFGMEYLCLKTLPEKQLNVDLVFLCEPTGLNVVLGQRGKVELVVKTMGRTAHSSRPEAGINALEKMIPVLKFIFNDMSHGFKTHELLGTCSVTVTNLVCRPGTLSIIPDECEISIDRRYMPGQDVDDLVQEFKDLFAEIQKRDPQFQASVYPRTFVERSYTGYEKEVRKYHPPWITDVAHPFVQKTLKALKSVGQQPKIDYWKFGTDGSMTAGLMGIPTIGYSGTEERYAHTPDEIVNIDMMMKSLEGYCAIIKELLGLNGKSL
jgi:putative selenium metabolism hydrolase